LEFYNIGDTEDIRGPILAQVGPGSILLGYVLVGVLCYAVMAAVGEMAAWLPISSGFTGFAQRFVDPALGWCNRVMATLKPMQHPDGGFGGGHGHAAHSATAYAVVLSTVLVGGTEILDVIDRRAMFVFFFLFLLSGYLRYAHSNPTAGGTG